MVNVLFFVLLGGAVGAVLGCVTATVAHLLAGREGRREQLSPEIREWIDDRVRMAGGDRS